jgi:hypothetical protein
MASWALVAFLFLLAVRAAFDPTGAADGFGMPVSSQDALPWLRIKADRDLGIALILMTVLLLRQRRVFGAITLVSVVMPLVDAVSVMGNGARSVGYALAVHGSAAVYGLLLGTWLLRTHAPTRREEIA